MKGGRAFVVTSGNAAKLLETIDEALNAVTQSIQRLVKRSATALVGASRNRQANPASSQRLAKGTTGVALVRKDGFGTPFGSSTSRTFDRALIEQLLGNGDFLLLTGRQQQGEQLAIPIGNM